MLSLEHGDSRKNSEHLSLIFHHCHHLDIPRLFSSSHYSLIRGEKPQLSYGPIFNYSVEKKDILFQVKLSSKQMKIQGNQLVNDYNKLGSIFGRLSK